MDAKLKNHLYLELRGPSVKPPFSYYTQPLLSVELIDPDTARTNLQLQIDHSIENDWKSLINLFSDRKRGTEFVIRLVGPVCSNVGCLYMYSVSHPSFLALTLTLCQACDPALSRTIAVSW